MQTRLVGPPKPSQLNPTSGVPGFLQGKLLAGLPVIFLVAIYVATQIAQWLKVIDFETLKQRYSSNFCVAG